MIWQRETSGCDTSSPLDLMHSKRSWVFFPGCSRYLGHNAVGWGITWAHFIFSLAFTNKKKTLIFTIFPPQSHRRVIPSFGTQKHGRSCGGWGTRLIPLLCSIPPTPSHWEGTCLCNYCPKHVPWRAGNRGCWPLEQCMKLQCVPQGQLSSGRVSLPNPKPLVTKQGRGLKALMFEHVNSAL